MFKKIDHIELIPKDIEKSIKFYTDILCFKIQSRFKIDSPPMREIAYLELGGTVIELISVDECKDQSQQEWRVGYRCIALEVENMDDTIEYLKSKSVSITWGPVDLGKSIRAEINDIDGLPIELREWKNK